jgi:ATP-dependent Clp protease protease subunit
MQPHSRIMLHQASSGFSGNVQDTRISFEQTEKLNKLLLKMLGELSGGKTLEEMEAYTIRDKWMDAEESIEFQIADKIVTPKK